MCVIHYPGLKIIVNDYGFNMGLFFYQKTSGGRLNKKDGLTRYGNSHVKDKTS